MTHSIDKALEKLKEDYIIIWMYRYFIRAPAVHFLKIDTIANEILTDVPFGFRAAMMPAIREKLTKYSIDGLLISTDRGREGPAFSLSLKGIEYSRDNDKSEEDLANINIPASDRFVALSDNLSEVVETKESLDTLISTVRESNGLFENSNEKDAALEELSAFRKLFDGAAIRLQIVRASISDGSLIKWLATQSMSGLVQASALGALGLLSKFLGLW